MHHDDLAQQLAGHGSVSSQRVSAVEPAAGGWMADLAPVGGPLLDPFARRDQALDAERH